MSSLKIDKILCPIDFSEDSKYAVKYAIGMAETFKATLHVMQQLPVISLWYTDIITLRSSM